MVRDIELSAESEESIERLVQRDLSKRFCLFILYDRIKSFCIATYQHKRFWPIIFIVVHLLTLIFTGIMSGAMIRGLTMEMDNGTDQMLSFHFATYNFPRTMALWFILFMINFSFNLIAVICNGIYVWSLLEHWKERTRFSCAIIGIIDVLLVIWNMVTMKTINIFLYPMLFYILYIAVCYLAYIYPLLIILPLSPILFLIASTTFIFWAPPLGCLIIYACCKRSYKPGFVRSYTETTKGWDKGKRVKVKHTVNVYKSPELIAEEKRVKREKRAEKLRTKFREERMKSKRNRNQQFDETII